MLSLVALSYGWVFITPIQIPKLCQEGHLDRRPYPVLSHQKVVFTLSDADQLAPLVSPPVVRPHVLALALAPGSQAGPQQVHVTGGET